LKLAFTFNRTSFSFRLSSLFCQGFFDTITAMIRSTRGSKIAGENTTGAAALALMKENEGLRVQLEKSNKEAEVSRGRERKALRGLQAQPNESNPGRTSRSRSKGTKGGRGETNTKATRSKSRDSKTNKRFSGNPKVKEEAYVSIKKEPELPEQMVKKTAKQTPKAAREQQSTSRSGTINASAISGKKEDQAKRRRCMLCGRNCGSHEDLLLHMDEHSHLIFT